MFFVCVLAINHGTLPSIWGPSMPGNSCFLKFCSVWCRENKPFLLPTATLSEHGTRSLSQQPLKRKILAGQWWKGCCERLEKKTAMKAQSQFFASAGFMAMFALLNFLKVNLKEIGCLLICAIFSRYLKFNWQLVLKSMSLVENTLHIHWISANTSLMKFPFNSLCSYETTHSKQKRVHYLVECCINSSESTRCKIKVTG